MAENIPCAAAPFPHKNILIVKPGAVGDLLQMTPVIRTLKKASPSVKITVLVGNEGSKDLFKNNPNVFEVLVFDRKGAHRSFRSFFALWQQIRGKRFDLILNFQRSNVKAWLLLAAVFPSRVLVYHKERRRSIHVVENYLETIAPLGITTSDFRLEYFPDARAKADADALLSVPEKGASPIVALNPGASHPVNRWPAHRFAELTDMLSEKQHAMVILIGGPADTVLAEEIISHSRTKPLSLAGRTSIPQLAALLQKCSVLVSGDTGPLHLATAVGTPAVALFGAADPLRTGPVGAGHRIVQASGVSCVPCRSRTCSHSRPLACMKAITPIQVFEAITSILDR